MFTSSIRVIAALGTLYVLSALSGCAHEVESPPVSIETLEPNLVCSAQRVTNPAAVVISGSGFTPMPTSVLALPSVLHLPTVELTGVADLAGTEITTPTVSVFSGDPEGTLASQLSWESREQMTFRIAEPGTDVVDGLDIAPGLYDVTVINPDEKRSATLERGLAVVPPPSITRVEPLPPVLCTDQEDREFTIQGMNFLKLGSTLSTVEVALGGTTEIFTPDAAEGCVAIPGTYAGVTAELCTSLRVTAPQGTLDPGAYQVTVVSPAPASCISSETATLVIVPPPFVDMLVPPAICIEQGDQEVTAEGGDFLQIGAELPVVRIVGDTEDLTLVPTLDDCTMLDGTEAADAVQVCTSLTVTITVGSLPSGDYDFTVENPAPAGCVSTQAITLTITSPPQVDTVVPSTVCEGGSALQITGAGFREGSTVLLRCPGDKVVEARSVSVTSDTELDALIGAGITVDEVCEVIVTNPEGCEDRPLPHKTVRGTAGPFVFFADPFVVFNGIDTSVTLFSTTIEQPLPSMPVSISLNNTPTAAVENFAATIVPGHPNRAQFTIPNGQAPGVYDVILSDNTGCSAVLEAAFTVTDSTTLTLESVDPPFGATGSRTAITVTRSGGVDFMATPRLFLNPASGPAVAVELVTLTDADTLTAVVPSGVPVGTYQLIVINPDGSVGVLDDAFKVQTEAPPVIRDVTPQSMTSNDTSADLTITGSDFRNPQVTLFCRTPQAATTTTVTATGESVTCVTASNCTLSATVDASVLSQGSICVVRVTNDPGLDDSYGEFSAIGVTGPSLNLPNPVAGTQLTMGRRALVASAVKATRVARFVYAIGGDGGSSVAATPFDSVEAAFVDVFGNMQPFQADAEPMTAARSFAGGTAIGRYLYVFGGSDGANALETAERALVLIPEETPTVQDVDLLLGSAGLDAGQWSYRVSAVFAANDPDNPNGESLASDTFIIRLPSVTDKKISVVLSWSRPLDVLGAPLANISGYRIYRTSLANETAGRDEVLLAEVDGSTLAYTDDGTQTPMDTIAPRPLGSTGRWHALPSLNVPRMGPAMAVALDPADTDPSDGVDHVLYALVGKNDTTAQASYEYLPITMLPNGRQTIAAQWTVGADSFAVGRWECGAWTADPIVAPVLDPDTWVYVGGGRLFNSTLTGAVEAARVTDGGELAIAADNAARDFNNDRSGYGVAAANGQLFTFGGAGGAPSSGAAAAVITGAPTLAMNAWNNEGISLTTARYLTGSTVQSAFIFLVGGANGTTATQSTELVIW